MTRSLSLLSVLALVEELGAPDRLAVLFEGESLVDQHQLVHDALGEHLTRDIHAIELTTKTPE